MSKSEIDLKNLGSSFKRYKGVTLSIAALLLFISGEMYVSTQISQRVHELEVQINAASVLSDESYNILVSTQAIHQEVLEETLEKQGGEHDHEPGKIDAHADAAKGEASLLEMQTQLTDYMTIFEEVNAKLESGGEYTLMHGANYLQPLTTAGTQEELKKAQAAWGKFRANVDKLVSFKPEFITHDIIEDIDNFRDEGHAHIYESVNKIKNTLSEEVA